MSDKQSAIVIRFAVQDGQKVSEALKRLEQDGTATFGKLDRASREPVRGLVLLQGAADEIRSRMAGLAGQAGIVGSAFAGAGPKLLAFAAALGVVTAGMKSLISTAPQMIADANAAGLSLEKFQSIRAGAVDAGGSREQAAQGLRQFAVQMRAAQMSTGDLYEEVRRLNPELARQLALSKDQDEALRIVRRALDETTLASQRARVGNAAFGENWRFIAEGVRRDQAGLVSADRIISPELVQRAAEVSAKINSIVDAISTRFMVAMGPAVELLDKFLRRFEQAGRTTLPPVAAEAGPVERLVRRIGNATGITSERRDQAAELDDLAKRRAAAQQRLDQLNRDYERIDADFNAASARVGRGLNEGASDSAMTVFRTVQDVARQRRLENVEARKAAQEELQRLAAEQERMNRQTAEATTTGRRQVPVITVTPSADARAAAAREAERQLLTNEQVELQRKVAAMGEAASASDRLRLSTIQLRLAEIDNQNVQQERLRLTQRDIDLTRSVNQVRIEAERTAARTALGIATEEERLALKRREIDNLRRSGVIRTDEEAARALALYRKELRETVNQEQVRASNTPGLTKIRQDATRDIRLDLDEVATTGINEYSRGLLGLTQQYKDLKTVALEWGAAVLSMMAQIALKRAVLGPLANALTSVVESVSGSLTKSAMGNVMTSAGPMSLSRYALGGVHSSPGGVARRPTLSMFGEGRVPEAYVPLPDGRNIPAVVDFRNFNPTGPLPRSTAAAAQMTTNVVVQPPAGHEAETQRSPNGQGGEDVRVVFKRMMTQALGQDLKDGGEISTMLALMGRKPAGKF